MLFRFEGIPQKTKSGDNSAEETPVPISNTAVKLRSADDTWREAARESRTLPVLFLYGSMVKRSRHRPFTAVTRVRFPVESPEKERAAEETAALHIWKVCGSGSGVEHRLAKARVASSNLVFRSNSFFGEKEKLCAIGGIGRRTRFRFWRATVGVQVPHRAPKKLLHLVV